MGPRTQDIEYIQIRLSRVKQVFASAFKHQNGDILELLMSESVAKDVLTELETLRRELEIEQLRKDVIPAANFLADSIFLFEKTIKEASLVQRDEPTEQQTDGQDKLPDFITQYYKKREMGERSFLLLKLASYSEAQDYYAKALELIKGPARKAGMEDLLFLN